MNGGLLSMTKVERKSITEAEAKGELENGMAHAEKVLDDADKIEQLLKKINFKKIEEEFSKILVMAEIVKAYVNKEYTKVPKRSIVAIVSAIIYFVNPFDLIPDVIPGIGQVDDLSVILVCWKMISKDIDDYLAWKNSKLDA